MALSRGAIQDIICCREGDDLPENPILQILGVKKLTSTSGERFRLIISDGVHYYTSSMLDTRLNHLVKEDMIEVKAVIQMTEYSCNIIKETRKVVIILEFSVIQRASEVNDKIGDPQQMSNLVSDHASLVHGQRQGLLQPSTSNVLSTPNVHANRPSSGQASCSTNHVNNGSSSDIASGDRVPSPSAKNIIPIAFLNPCKNKWTIRARVTHKTDIRMYNNQRGKLFSVYLLDESGEVRATGFNDVVDRYFNMIEQGKVYFIIKGSLQAADKKFSYLKNNYEIVLNNDTLIERCDENCNIPLLPSTFMKIKDIENVGKDSLIDILGVVKSPGEVTEITTRDSSRQVMKREITIVDQSQSSIRLTLWDRQATNFEVDADSVQIVAIRGAKVSEYGGRTLSTQASSFIHVNPDIPEANLLREWFESNGINEDILSLSFQGVESAGNLYKTIGQIKDENLGMGERADYFSIRAWTTFHKKENCLYQACPGQNCMKKVTEDNGQYRCEKCDQTYPDFNYRFILSSCIADHSSNQWIKSFKESGEMLLGISADQLGKMREEENKFEQVFADAMFKPFVFKMKANMQMYQDQPQLNCVCISVAHLDYKRECNRLLREIEKLESI